MPFKSILLLLITSLVTFAQEEIIADSTSIKIKLANPSNRYLEIKGININEEFSFSGLRSLFSIDSIGQKIVLEIGDFNDFWLSVNRDSLEITLHGSNEDLNISQKVALNYFYNEDGSGGVGFVEEIDTLFSLEIELQKRGNTYRILSPSQIGLPEHDSKAKEKAVAIKKRLSQHGTYYDVFPEISAIILYISVPDYNRKEIHLSLQYGD